MKLFNVSKLFSSDKLREVIEFTRPAGISNFQVRVTKARWAYAGRAYPEHQPQKVIVRICTGLKFPLRREAHGGYLSMEVYTTEELLVYLMAHELRHLWQGKGGGGVQGVGRPGAVFGA